MMLMSLCLDLDAVVPKHLLEIELGAKLLEVDPVAHFNTPPAEERLSPTCRLP